MSVRIISFIISLSLVISLSGCKKEAASDTEVQAQPPVAVQSAMPTAEKQQYIIDIKPLEKLKIDYVWWACVIGGVVIVLLLILGGIIYYRRRKKIQEVVIKLPPHEVALTELNKLRAMKCADAKAIKKLYFELSETFRHYLEGRYGFPATEWTSEEITYHINRTRDLNFELKEQSKSFLSNTDLVKFAEYLPQEAQIQEELNRAISFVEATKEVIVEGSQADAL